MTLDSPDKHASQWCCVQNGGIPPLVRLLRDDPDEISAELSAVVLRNLALQNAINRAAIKDAGGLQPLLRLLSMGQEKLVYPLTCEVSFPFAFASSAFACIPD